MTKSQKNLDLPVSIDLDDIINKKLQILKTLRHISKSNPPRVCETLLKEVKTLFSKEELKTINKELHLKIT